MARAGDIPRNGRAKMKKNQEVDMFIVPSIVSALYGKTDGIRGNALKISRMRFGA
ncbi:MAG: hypothetical protein WAS24_06070 [Thermoplasmata archaeon]